MRTEPAGVPLGVGIGMATERRPPGRALTAGLVVETFVGAVEMIVVVAIMPVIAADIGGLALYGWVFSAYMFAMLVALPLAGRSGDKRGPMLPYVWGVVAYAVGTLACGFAPSMLFLVFARLVQGWGAGAKNAVVLLTVAKLYPEESRPKMIAILSAAWVVPGLVGPTFGTLIATTVGWRWAFLSVLGLLPAAALLVIPTLRDVKGQTDCSSRVAVERIRDRRLRIAVGLAFLSQFAIFGTDAFVPLMLTEVRQISVRAAGLAVTLVAVGWAIGAWVQSRMASSISHARLVAVGGSLMAAGICGVVITLAPAPVWVAYVAWTVAGFGMGIAYSVVHVVVMSAAGQGREGTATSAAQFAGTLGGAVAPALGGLGVALAAGGRISLTVGLSWAFGLSILAAALLVVGARLLSDSAGRYCRTASTSASPSESLSS